MSEYKTVARLNPDDPLWAIFPAGEVPLLSVIPLPINGFPELCYLVDGLKLTEQQLNKLSNDLFLMWASEIDSVQVARDYILDGLPMLLSRFAGTETNDPSVMTEASNHVADEDYCYIWHGDDDEVLA